MLKNLVCQLVKWLLYLWALAGSVYVIGSGVGLLTGAYGDFSWPAAISAILLLLLPLYLLHRTKNVSKLGVIEIAKNIVFISVAFSAMIHLSAVANSGGALREILVGASVIAAFFTSSILITRVVALRQLFPAWTIPIFLFVEKILLRQTFMETIREAGRRLVGK